MRYPRAKRRISPIAATSPAAAVTFTGNGDQPLDCRIAENDLRHLAVEQGQVLSQAIELAHMPFDPTHLVGWHLSVRVEQAF
jgi:hypothetical protein